MVCIHYTQTHVNNVHTIPLYLIGLCLSRAWYRAWHTEALSPHRPMTRTDGVDV